MEEKVKPQVFHRWLYHNLDRLSFFHYDIKLMVVKKFSECRDPRYMI